MIGVACFDCHVNGHTNKATRLVGDIRPQEFRHRINTPTLRGVNVRRLFGSQRALKTLEDFTEFEQRGAYFDGDRTMASNPNTVTAACLDPSPGTAPSPLACVRSVHSSPGRTHRSPAATRIVQR